MLERKFIIITKDQKGDFQSQVASSLESVDSSDAQADKITVLEWLGDDVGWKEITKESLVVYAADTKRMEAVKLVARGTSRRRLAKAMRMNPSSLDNYVSYLKETFPIKGKIKDGETWYFLDVSGLASSSDFPLSQVIVKNIESEAESFFDEE